MNTHRRAEQLDKEGKCIVCEVQFDRRRRGLCTTDYNRFISAMRHVPADRREQFEAELIAAGELLPSRQGQRGVIEDVFSKRLAKFLGSVQEKWHQAVGESTGILADEAANTKKEAEKEAPKKKRRSRKH